MGWIFSLDKNDITIVLVILVLFKTNNSTYFLKFVASFITTDEQLQ